MTLADRIGVMVAGRLVAVHDADKRRHGRDRPRDRRRRRMSGNSASKHARLSRRIAPNALPIAIVVIVIAFALAQPAFLKPENLIGIVRQVALIGIMATCTTFVIMTGGVDLSVGPVLAIAGLVSYYCLEARSAAAGGLPPACRRRAGRCGQRRDDRLSATAADHRDARHAQHRARVGADSRRPGAASDPRRAGLIHSSARATCSGCRSQSTSSRSSRC